MLTIFFSTDNKAANPVVATVLLVGIVIILSASIGTFVLGISSGLNDGAQAGADITAIEPSEMNGSVVVSVISMGNADRVTITAVASGGNTLLDFDGSNTGERVWSQDSVGNSVIIEEGDKTGSGADTTIQIIVVAHTASADSVILNREVTI